jgi:hypothetical protein
MKPFLNFSLLIATALAMSAAPANMFRNGARHSGAYNAPGVPQLHGVKWKFHTAGQVMSSPAVVGDVMYLGSTDHHHLYALDHATGGQECRPTHFAMPRQSQ